MSRARVPEARLEPSEAGLVGDARLVRGQRPRRRLGHERALRGRLRLRGRRGAVRAGRRLRAWDFVHCPPDTEHIFVGAGDGPCVLFMTGARTGRPGNVYVRSELALRHGAGVERETPSSPEAYAPFGRWRPGPPASWSGLPWELR